MYVVEALKKVRIPNLRWPGGCFADKYHWKDGISPMTKQRAANGCSDPCQVSFWGIGNENWGCGRDMSPDYYTDLDNRYGSFTESYAGTRVNKIASGPSGGILPGPRYF
jgi:alpha-L-arabinofuranosidase